VDMTEELITSWLRQQLDEDERVAQPAYDFTCGTDDYFDVYYMAVPLQVHANRWCPARVLREVEAHRRILAAHRPGSDPCDAHDASLRTIECETLRLLASIYSDRPGFRQEWAPE